MAVGLEDGLADGSDETDASALVDAPTDSDGSAEAEGSADADGFTLALGEGDTVGVGKNLVGTFRNASTKIRMTITNAITTHGLARRSFFGGSEPR